MRIFLAVWCGFVLLGFITILPFVHVREPQVTWGEPEPTYIIDQYGNIVSSSVAANYFWTAVANNGGWGIVVSSCTFPTSYFRTRTVAICMMLSDTGQLEICAFHTDLQTYFEKYCSNNPYEFQRGR